MIETRPTPPSARTRLLTAALSLIRRQGFSATSVDELCAAAGVTKGAFFHHFRSKEDLGVAAARHWSDITGTLFATAAYHDLPDPLERIYGYLDLRASLAVGGVPDFTCLAGTMLQETYDSHPPVGEASYASITGHATTLEADFQAAIELYSVRGCPSARSLALHTQTVLQGAFIQAKGKGDAEPVHEALDHLRRYLNFLFPQPQEGSP